MHGEMPKKRHVEDPSCFGNPFDGRCFVAAGEKQAQGVVLDGSADLPLALFTRFGRGLGWADERVTFG